MNEIKLLSREHDAMLAQLIECNELLDRAFAPIIPLPGTEGAGDNDPAANDSEVARLLSTAFW